MRLVPINLGGKEVCRIRAGEMFQVGTQNHGVFKGPARRDECGILFFSTPTSPRITISEIDTLLRIEILGKKE